MTEGAGSRHDIDLFNKQAILKGERVPIIFTLFPNDIAKESGGKAWIGDNLPAKDIIPKTESEEQAKALPWAMRYQDCTEDANGLCFGNDQVEKYNSVCWVPRKGNYYL